VTLDGSVSSQYVSALLMSGRCMSEGLTVRIRGDLASKPYVNITLDVMEAFGARVDREDYSLFRTEPGGYTGREFEIEADATAATYFLAAAAITGGEVCVKGLGTTSRQGDVGFAQVLEKMGCSVQMRDREIVVSGRAQRGIDVDLNSMPDTAPSLAQVALFADGPTTIRNVPNLRVKECDRIEALATELRKIGAAVDVFPDGLRITPPRRFQPAQIETYNDHRIAMSFSVLGLAVPGIVILNPGCVSKTYPGFFEDLHTIRA
jgi:3-phosphoshikimate 1-carboxyvinyltransferase